MSGVFLDRRPAGSAPAHWPRRRRQLARGVTEVLAPTVVVSALLVAVGWHSAASAPEALGWALVAVVFAAVVPLVYILRGVRRQRLTDHHVGLREQRPVPLLVGVVSVLAGLVLLTLGRAPRDLIALVGAMGVGLVASLLVTLVWKVSIHTAVVAGAVVVLVVVFGPALLAFAPALALVAWARVEVGDHTALQTLAGAALGGAIAAVCFSLLR
jgi:membrane-associated phospholipid phosphatase